MVGFPLLDLIRHRITVRRLAPVSTRSDHADRSMVAMALGVERRFAHALLNFGSVRYLVAPSRSRDLRQSAKHLFLRAMRRRSQPRVKGLPKFGGAAGRAAPHQRGRSRLANATTDSMRLSASAHPSIGVDAKGKREPETQTCATGTRGAARREPRSGLLTSRRRTTGGRAAPSLGFAIARAHARMPGRRALPPEPIRSGRLDRLRCEDTC